MDNKKPGEIICFRCKKPFTCAVATGNDQSCWCFWYPRMMPLPADDTSTGCACICPDCLEERIKLGSDQDESDTKTAL